MKPLKPYIEKKEIRGPRVTTVVYVIKYQALPADLHAAVTKAYLTMHPQATVADLMAKETFIIAGGKLKTFRDLVKQYYAEA